jgi:putative methionine-R-sulfoxide reductase with GAF domain
MKTATHQSVLEAVDEALTEEREPMRAMERVVAILKRDMPSYTWVGIYLLRRRAA